MICPRCGKEVTGAMYCLNCGLKIRSYSEASKKQRSFLQVTKTNYNKPIAEDILQIKDSICTQPTPPKNNKSVIKNSIAIIMIAFLVGFILNLFHSEHPMPIDKPVPIPIAENVVDDSLQMIDYNGKQHEMLEAFNNLFSSENNFTPIYAGVAYDSSMDTLIPKVNDNWHLLSEDAKIAFVKTSFISWNTMAKARKIDLKTDKLHISVISSLSGEEVASWGPILGTNINR